MLKLTVITLQPCVILKPWVVPSLHPAISLFRTFGLAAYRTRFGYLLPICQALSTWRLISSLISLMNEMSGTLERMSSNKFPKSGAHQTLMRSIYEIIHIFELRLSIKVKNDHRSKFSNLSNWKEEAWKNQGFSGIRTRDLRDTGAMLYHLSYEVTHRERGQFIEFISPVRSEMMWSIYEIIHIFELRLSIKVKNDHRSKFSNLSNLRHWSLCILETWSWGY